jgi:hypothetical protein
MIHWMTLLAVIAAGHLILLGLPARAFATPYPMVNNWVASDNFNSYLNGNLNAQNGGSGWSGGWDAGSYYAVQDSVTYEGAKAVAATEIPDSVQVNRGLAAGIKSGIVRFAIRRGVTGGTADWIVALSYNPTGESYPVIRVLSNDIYFGYGSGSFPLVVNYAADTWYVIHLRFDTVANAFYAREDSQSFWTGPLQTTDGPVGGDVRYLRIVDNGTNSGTFYIDDIRPGSEPFEAPSYATMILNAPDGHSFGAPVAFVGDFNADQIPDLAVAELAGGHIYLFSGLDGSRLPQTFDTGCGGLFGGGAIHMTGIQVRDAIGNLVPGIVAACPGRVYLFTASGNQPFWMTSQDLEGQDLEGFGVAAVPDKTGDGIQDILVGGNFRSGVVLNGQTGEPIPDIRLPGFLYDTSTGHSLFDVGDVNHDGVRDYFVGDVVVSGTDGSSILLFPSPPSPPVVAYPSGAVPLGDVDGDGVTDIAISANAPGDAIPGYVFVFSAGQFDAGTNHAKLLYTIVGDSDINGSYNGLAPAGDFDGDGITDLLVAQGASTSSDGENGGPGRVVVYSGKFNDGGTSGSRLFELDDPTGANPSGFGKGALFPNAIAGGVDLNGDGIPDILVGAPWANEGQGQVFLFLSSASPTATPATASGNAVAVSPAPGVTVTFSGVSASGDTTVTASDTGPSLPSALTTGDPPTFYEITTTAAYSAPITVCVKYDPAQSADPATLRILHFESGAWVDVTTSIETSTRTICGRVNTLSPFVIATLAYRFSGFFEPVNNLPTVNLVKGGSGVPVKFSLDGNQGLNIFAAGYPASRSVECNSTDPIDVVEETVSASTSGLTYDASAGQYVYVWKTDKSWASTCRQFVLRLNDGSYHRANFKFR